MNREMILNWNTKTFHNKKFLRGDCNIENQKSNINFEVSYELYQVIRNITSDYKVCSKCNDLMSREDFDELEVEDLPMDLINLDDLIYNQIYPRFEVNSEVIEDYFEAIVNNNQLPPVLAGVYETDEETKLILLDGFHRFKAYEKFYKTYYGNEIILKTIKAKVIKINDEKDLLKWSAYYNSRHGLRLKKEEKINYIRKMYQKGFEVEEIAEIMNVSKRTIYNYISDLVREKKEEELKEKKEKIEKIIELKQQGKTIKEISEETGIPEGSVKKYLQIETNLTNYGIRSANLHSLSTNSPNYENWTWNVEFPEEQIKKFSIQDIAWNEEKEQRIKAYFLKIFELIKEAGLLFDEIKENNNRLFTFSELLSYFYKVKQDEEVITALYRTIALLDYLRTSEPFNRRLRIKFINAKSVLEANKIDLKGIINNGL
jgi:predicted DNA-binding protein YlxM (UPF0122 family)